MAFVACFLLSPPGIWTVAQLGMQTIKEQTTVRHVMCFGLVWVIDRWWTWEPSALGLRPYVCALRRHTLPCGRRFNEHNNPEGYLKHLSLCDRYACGHRCVSGQVTRCGAAVMASTTPRLFSVTVLTVVVGLVSSSQDHEWHFNPGENKILVFLLFF